MMHGHEKSRSAIVAVKPTNKAERFAAEPAERRAETKGNADQQRTRRTQRRISVSKMLARIRQHIVAVDTQGGNRMRESRTYGSVRGALSNERPYRESDGASLPRWSPARQQRGRSLHARSSSRWLAFSVAARQMIPWSLRPPGLERGRLCRGPKCPHRVSLGGVAL